MRREALVANAAGDACRVKLDTHINFPPFAEMCGRFALKTLPPEIMTRFGLDECFDFGPRYNIAPSQAVAVLRQDAAGRRSSVSARWGLLPSWVKDGQGMPRPINAKSETAALKPMFRHAFRKSRILVPADGFYEWKAAAGQKQPYLIHMRDGLPFGMAGLLERWHGPEGDVLSFAILTTQANLLMAEIHDRMPAIVKPEDYAKWLDPARSDVEELQGMIGPYPERFMEAYAVSRRVNYPKNDGADLFAPLADA